MRLARDKLGLTDLGLPGVCRSLGVPLVNRHDPVSDATACARIMIMALGITGSRPFLSRVEREPTV